ncbi:myb-related protein [Tripterygium wilfordii]|uniref:Myb-related protein n=1 Tax=Tripterygium wilfordii TaxID=458696 RepID=A0A7J7BUH6_TRIWF|nr:myb-related protein [Tripterygium wilfordii]
MAKQALSEALSPEFIQQPAGQEHQASTYISSTENIAKLLQGWMKDPPKSSSSIVTDDHQYSQKNKNPKTNYTKDEKNEMELSEAFESALYGFESFDSSNSDLSQSQSPGEASIFQDESKPSINNSQEPLSLLEKWLFDEGAAASQGKDCFSDIKSDENNIYPLAA